MKQLLAITRKELYSYFGSPMALIFIGVFLAATLFSFFWLDTFFARGIADVRPLFRWMPILLIFLVAALTMRQWSAEVQSGAIEVLLTLPVRFVYLVLGKFLAVMSLVSLALLLTLPLPITVAWLGNLDWGPVLGGYIAALLLATAYAAVGLFVSARTSNDVVALIVTVLITAVLHLIGTRGLTEFVGESAGTALRAFSTSARFESIERGVIDLRDLLYYLSIAAIFLALNVLALDAKRWSASPHTARYRFNANLTIFLLALNLATFNLWIAPISVARADLTEQREYTLSPATKGLIGSLQDTLLIRAYFSERTHPLLSPLVPRIVDMLREYEVAAEGRAIVEIVDPAQHPELEAEANQTYGIRPTPFQVADRYESGLVNAYFDVLVRYGDQSEILNFRDLIEIESFRDGQIDVRLRNIEYDLTRAIKKTVYGFQGLDSILAALPTAARLTLFVTPATLPEHLAGVPELIQKVSNEIVSISGGKFDFYLINPTDVGAGTSPQLLLDNYGIQPFAASLFGDSTYYLHMLMEVEGQTPTIIYPTGDLGEAEIRTSIESALKRFSSGFLQVVGIWRPTIGPDPMMAQFGQNQQPPFSTWNALYQQLLQEYAVEPLDLSTGQVPANIDVALIIAPQGMSTIERYALDQFLMRGGAAIVAGSSFRVGVDSFTGSLTLTQIEDGLHEMLDHYGIKVDETLVMDPQNEPFPIAISRDVGGFAVQELQAINYPYFVDIRADGMTQESPIIASLPAVTLNWTSPLQVDEAKNSARDVSVLLHSSSQSWLRSDLNIQPNLELYPDIGFPQAEARSSYPLAVSIIGSFESFFLGKELPQSGSDANQPAPAALPSLIERSPANTRLVVIGSGDFLNDTVFTISSQLAYERYFNSLQLIQNAVDWSVEDLELLTIRSRGAYARVLQPLDPSEQAFWEFLNYAIALTALIAVAFIWQSNRRNEQPMRLNTRYEDQVDPEVSIERA
jgi:ABC-2 type transport system permease protein